MASTFDPQLTELTYLTSNSMVDVYKVGGGTLGQAYEGRWGYLVRRHGTVVGSGEDLNTGTPKTHQQAAQLACDFLPTQHPSKHQEVENV